MDGDLMRVVMNHEEQYSIWPINRELPDGWNDTGMHGSKADCLAYVEQTWTDLRPRSLREHVARYGTAT